jgi:cytochrome b561
MFALPISGWLMSSAAGIPASFFGLFDLPDLISRNESLFRTFIQIHKWLGYALIALIGVHAGAALRHHFLLRDETLKKMLPGMGA